MRAVPAAFVAAFVLLLPPTAEAYQVHISITGAGQVTETTSADLVSSGCVTSANNPTGVVGKDCYAGTPTGDYGWNWDVDYLATPMPGYSFVRWQSDGTSTPGVICDRSSPAATTTTYTGTVCKFRTPYDLQTRAVFADTTAPTMASLSGPNQPVNGATTFTFSAAADPTVTGFECRVANVHDWLGCSSGRSENPATGGTYTFEVRAVDASGNKSAISTWNWTVDKLAPETSLTAAPSGAVASTSASFEFGSNEQGTFSCRLDGGVFATCGSPKSYSSLGQGSHTFEVRAVDAAGNQDATPATRTWTVDTVAPDTALTDGPADGSQTTATTATFGLASEPGAAFRCQLDAGPVEDCASPRSYAGLASGAHTVKAWARDAVGNQDPTPATRSWTVVTAPDTTAPETTITSGPAQDSTTESTAATLEFGSSEGGTFECALDGAAFTPCTSPAALGALGVGAHTFRVRARDAAGNVDASPAARTWTVSAPAGTGTGGTGTGSGTPAFDPRFTSAFTWKGTKTRFTKLVITRLPEGTKLLATCAGKGCPFKRATLRVRRAKLDVLKAIKKLERTRLRAGAVLQLRATGADGRQKVASWRIRNGKAPKMTYRCAAPGGKLGRC